MARIKVKTVSFPQRCEICHQTDAFSPESGKCQRCQDIPLEELVACESDLSLSQRIAFNIKVNFDLLMLRLFPVSDARAANLFLVKLMICFVITLMLTGFFLTAANHPPQVSAPPLPADQVKENDAAKPGQSDRPAQNNPNLTNDSPIYVPARPDIFAQGDKKEEKIR